MVPEVADWVLDDMLVDVVSEHDSETREKRARKIRCPSCMRRYEAMEWKPSSDPAVPELHCPCGEVFPLSIVSRHTSSASSSGTE